MEELREEIIEERRDVNEDDNDDDDNSDNLMGSFTDSFHELTRALEFEQTKLMELDKRRQKIDQQIKDLRKEVEEEKLLFEEDINRIASEQRITESDLPDPIDVLDFNIELKSAFMREFLAQKTAEIKAQMKHANEASSSSENLTEIKDIENEVIETDTKNNALQKNTN